MNQVSTPPVRMHISPRFLFFLLTACTVFLGLMAGISLYLRYEMGFDAQWGFARQFHMSEENNLPSWYSSTILLLCAGILAMIACAKQQARDPFAMHWVVLGGLFLGLSVDEAASLHEQLNLGLARIHRGAGLWFYEWVIPAAILVFLVGIAYLRFLMALPGQTRVRFVLAAGLYVGGALGCEMIEGWHDSLYGKFNLTGRYQLLILAEELSEMLGVAVFAYALAVYYRDQVGSLLISFSSDRPPQALRVHAPSPGARSDSMGSSHPVSGLSA